MIEKVARAIADARAYPGSPKPRVSDVDRRAARAALEAMREPTPRMIEAGCEARNLVAGTKWIDGVSEGVQSIERMLCERQWSAMIDAALDGERDGA